MHNPKTAGFVGEIGTGMLVIYSVALVGVGRKVCLARCTTPVVLLLGKFKSGIDSHVEMRNEE